ncbi:MAG: PepSY domain-containing protein [Oscillospiraceae bacterium]|nr:PepSY domain-containing protein [Oscillospiraceae bacterium]
MKNFTNANALNDKELETVVGGINQDQAMAAALQHAHVAGGQAMMSKCKLDYEHGRKVYEIEFYFNGMEYEYDIDADTGAVLKAKRDWDD